MLYVPLKHQLSLNYTDLQPKIRLFIVLLVLVSSENASASEVNVPDVGRKGQHVSGRRTSQETFLNLPELVGGRTVPNVMGTIFQVVVFCL
jgi:hypothetical protein